MELAEVEERLDVGAAGVQGGEDGMLVLLVRRLSTPLGPVEAKFPSFDARDSTVHAMTGCQRRKERIRSLLYLDEKPHLLMREKQQSLHSIFIQEVT